MIEIEVEGKVPSKSNTYGIGRGNFYKATVVDDYETTFFYQTLNVPKSTFKPDEYLCIEYWFYVKNMGQDADNIEKTVNDCLQKCCIIHNDKKIIEHHTYKIPDRKNPRIKLKIYGVKKTWTLTK